MARLLTFAAILGCLMAEVVIRFDSAAHTPTVDKMLGSDAFVRCIRGPFGSGKTSGCVFELARRACQQRPGPDGVRRTRFVAVRNSYRELKDTTRKTFENWVPAGAAGHWVESDFKFMLKVPHLQGGPVESEILFRALDRPGDIAKVLSLELTGAYVNEAREVPKVIFDGLQGRVGRYPAVKDGGCTWSGVWMDTNPWPVGHWGHDLFEGEKRPADFELYVQPSGLSAEAENLGNLPGGRGYYLRLCSGKDSEFIDCYVHGACPKSDIGSYFGALLAQLEARGGLAAFEHELDGVFTFWDLGLTDATSIWFTRLNQHRAFDYIDHYEGAGFPMSHYFALVKQWNKERGYQYAKHCLPHDARARTLQTGRSILDMCIDEWGAGAIEIVPKLSVEDRIQAGRHQFERPIRIHPRCRQRNGPSDTDAVECLRNYHKEWDEERKVYKTTPVHDWTSNTADSYTYSAVFADIAEQNTRPKVTPPTPKVRSLDSFTLDELWAMEEQEQRGRKRIP